MALSRIEKGEPEDGRCVSFPSIRQARERLCGCVFTKRPSHGCAAPSSLPVQRRKRPLPFRTTAAAATGRQDDPLVGAALRCTDEGSESHFPPLPLPTSRVGRPRYRELGLLLWGPSIRSELPHRHLFVVSAPLARFFSHLSYHRSFLPFSYALLRIVAGLGQCKNVPLALPIRLEIVFSF